jgi:hypothetical protein
MAATATDSVRRLIQDGPGYNLVRQEDLSDLIPAQATPTQTSFYVRFSSVPTEQYVTVFAVPGTLLAYVDGGFGVGPRTDVDINGTFILPSAPTSSLLATYQWQYFMDADIADFVDRARGWVGGPNAYPDLTTVPDGLMPALIDYGASLACAAMARKCSLADVRAGEAEARLSALARQYAAQAQSFETSAAAASRRYWTRADQTAAPGMDLSSIGFSQYQPMR